MRQVAHITAATAVHRVSLRVGFAAVARVAIAIPERCRTGRQLTGTGATDTGRIGGGGTGGVTRPAVRGIGPQVGFTSVGRVAVAIRIVGSAFDAAQPLAAGRNSMQRAATHIAATTVPGIRVEIDLSTVILQGIAVGPLAIAPRLRNGPSTTRQPRARECLCVSAGLGGASVSFAWSRPPRGKQGIR